MGDEVASEVVSPLDLAAERQQISAQRAQQEALFLRQQGTCYQRFAVNGCLLEARRERRVVFDELRRREVLLNELDRQTQAIDALNRIQENLSPERQQQVADQAEQARQDTQARQSRNDEKNAARLAPPIPAAPNESPRLSNTLTDTAQNERAFAHKLAEAKQRKADLENRLRQQGKGAGTLPVPN
jgi:FtsZ-interacting cell division protein ZipA